ncbi:HAD-IA family hydrolase [Pseudonocardia benzenivorans]|jgi:putative hydrolase of the HAD superfamily|uniref:HAD-superfamily hydrolase, phosphatase n=2 Tax=Pseudonocardia TaxID=1847 RepID=F4CQH7_PSEUX|nr:HAD-IA family hydrolase [Pseudonocardia dioxanivorans]AEA22575.1 HAD-superfamily hydrolase, phosphatase [Pseudonocardia dioxanivorans CB1190]GJF07601.1 haloacid dehalogenase [Pseudonocardia sp. D17]
MTRTTVVFDFGGVITTSPFDAFNRMEAERGLPRDLVRRINTVNPDTNAWAQFERAEIDEARFDTLFAEEARALGYDLPGRDVLALLSGDLRPALVEALDRLRAMGYRLGCITNNVPAGHGAQMSPTARKAEAIAAVMARFDHVVESSKVGVRKPDPRVYTMACDALGVRPEECVYLDDLGINCKPAAALGMLAIKVTSAEQALADLEQALGLGAGALTTPSRAAG